MDTIEAAVLELSNKLKPKYAKPVLTAVYALDGSTFMKFNTFNKSIYKLMDDFSQLH